MFRRDFWGQFAGMKTDGDVDNYERTLMPSEVLIKKNTKKRDAEIA